MSKTFTFTYVGSPDNLMDNLVDKEERFQHMMEFLEARGSEYATVHWLADRNGPYSFWYDAMDRATGMVDSYFLPAMYNDVAS